MFTFQFSKPSASIENPINVTAESVENSNVTPDAWRGAMKVFAGLCVLCIICGLAMRPLPKKPKVLDDRLPLEFLIQHRY